MLHVNIITTITEYLFFSRKTRLIAISRVLRAFSDRPTDRVAYRVACTRLKVTIPSRHRSPVTPFGVI